MELKPGLSALVTGGASGIGDLVNALEKHVVTYGGLEICINSAGINTSVPFHKDQTDGACSWRHALNIKAMESAGRTGVIINMGSASGLYPMYTDPIYSGSKEIALKVDSELIDLRGGFVPMELVVKGAFELITDESKAGSCLWNTKRRGMQYWPSAAEEAKFRVQSLSSRRRSLYKGPVNLQLPKNFEKIVVHTSTHNCCNATLIIHEPQHVLVKILYAGVNASDAVRIIAAVGDSVKYLKVGMPAALMTFRSYAEFTVVPAKHVLLVVSPDPEVVSMPTLGLTASIPLEKAGQMESGQAVLVTAAAGGTGRFSVQLAKIAGNTVIATCGGREKAMLLKEQGVDRLIDYKAEDVKTRKT